MFAQITNPMRTPFRTPINSFLNLVSVFWSMTKGAEKTQSVTSQPTLGGWEPEVPLLSVQGQLLSFLRRGPVDTSPMTKLTLITVDLCCGGSAPANRGGF
jgi:hypothetical protein